jgi:predicted Zn-dependent peptidase
MASYRELVGLREQASWRAAAQMTAAQLASSDADWMLASAALGEAEARANEQRALVAQIYEAVLSGRESYERFEAAAAELASAVSEVSAAAGPCSTAELRGQVLRRQLAQQQGQIVAEATPADLALARTIVDGPPLDADAAAPVEAPTGLRAWLNRHGTAGGGA